MMSTVLLLFNYVAPPTFLLARYIAKKGIESSHVVGVGVIVSVPTTTKHHCLDCLLYALHDREQLRDFGSSDVLYVGKGMNPLDS